MNSVSETNNTDEGGVDVKKSKHKTGKGAQQRRTEAFRRKKNLETDAAIQAGIFARLKIKDPTAVSSIPLASEVHPAIVPVTFSTLPSYVDRVWDTMEATGTRPFSALNTLENKNTFKKGMQILAEVKLCYAQRAHQDKPDEDLPSRKLYTTEELHDFNNMAEHLPYPLAIYLECIGNTADRKQVITPVLAEIQGEFANVSGAITYAPRNLLPLLRILREGVCANNEVHTIAQALDDLPGIEWEEFCGPAVPPAAAPRMVRLTRASFNFWTEPDHQNFKIKWTDQEYRMFVKIVQSMASRRGFNVTTDLSHGSGSLAQIVQTPGWDVSRAIDWFAMTDIPEYDQKLGSAFGFCNYRGSQVQASRFSGTYSTSYIRGEITPRRVMNAILANQE
ncbi:unnamed protein product [Colias eurytheme]|nr:unnamed protein product [Colias eurytheme]